MKKCLIAVVIITTIFLSCSSFEHSSRNVPDLKEVLLEDIEVLLSEGLAVEAVQDIDFLWREGRLLQSERDFFKTKAVENMVTNFYASIQDEDYYSAYRIYVSLDALSQGERLPDWSEGKLLLALAGRLEESGKDLSALSVRLHILNLLSEDELYDLLDFTFNMGNIPALKLALKRANEMELIVEEKYVSKALEKISKTDMQNGMVTVWVDKGIRIERGIGYPDRMMGSGFFVDSKGYIITNYHVIESEVNPEYEGYSRLFVRLSGRPDERVPAKVVGWDRIFDLALIEVELAPDFVFYSAGSVPVEPGQKIYTIGSPVDPFLENTITSGIISAIGRRRLLQMGDVIQLDAPVNPGNSGGPMLNENGELLGIVFAGFQLYEGLSFAIPVQWLNKILPRLYQGGEIKHPWLGLSLRETDKGMEVIYTVPGEAAMRGGIKPGDRILSVNGNPLKSVRDFQSYLIDFPVQTLVRIEWERNGEINGGLFSLRERPYSPIELALERDREVNLLVPLFGMELKKIGNFLWETNYVVEKIIPGSIADDIGLSINDPVNIQDWHIDTENRFVMLHVFVQKKKSGFLEKVVRLVAYMEPDNFI